MIVFVARADRRLTKKIIEGVLADPIPVSSPAKYFRPIHCAYKNGIGGGRFEKPDPTLNTRILCVGCSFTNLHFGWPYFLSKILPEGYEIVDMGWTGAGLEMFEKISDLLVSYDPNYVICQGMSPVRVLGTKEQQYQDLVEEWLSDSMTLEEESSIRMIAWLSFRPRSPWRIERPISKDLFEDHKKSMQNFKNLFTCPVIYMCNEYDYPYYDQWTSLFCSIRDQFDVVTSFKGIEYSTYGWSRKDEVWYPSVKRAKEEAEILARFLETKAIKPL